MGSLCTSLFGQSQTTGYQAPPEIKSAITDILNRAAVQSNQPYPQYTPETAAQYMGYNPGLVAPLTPNQAAAGQTISGMQGYTQPYFGAATQLAAGAALPVMAQPFSGQAVNQYMSPYLSDVVNSAVANINQTNAQQQQQVLGNAIQKGAFGGDRAGIAQAELARQQNLANNATIANLLNQGYGQALNQFNVQQQLGANLGLQNRQLMSNAALNLANLGTQGQQAALQQAQAQYGYGTQEQQQQQANLSTAYQQYLQQQAFPYQQLSYYAGLASGAAPAMGGQTTVYSPTQSLAGGVLGGLNTLGQLTNPASYQSKGFLSGIGNLMGGFTGINPLGAPTMKQGGRVGYADGGAPTNQSIREAYDDYVGAVSSGAPYDVLMQLYNRYQQAFKNASLPGQITPVQPAAKADVAAEKAAPASATTGGGGGGGAGLGREPLLGSSNERGGFGALDKDSYTVDPSGIVLGTRAYDPTEAGADFSKSQFAGQQQSGLAQGLGQLASFLIPGMGLLNAFNRDPKVVAEEMGKMYAEPNRVAAEAYDDAGNPIEFANTASGQNLAEYMAQMGIEDPSQVRMGMTQVNGRWQPEFFKDSTLGRLLHANSVAALDVPGVTYGSDSASRQAEEGFAIPGGGGGVAGATAGAATPGKFGMADLASLNKAYGLPTGYLEAQAQIESGMNPAAKNPYSSAAGMYQIIKSNYEKAGIDPYDPSQAAGWTAQNAADNAEKLRNAGYPVSNATLALAHNFGIQGALALLSNPQRDIFQSLKTVMPEDQALAAVTSNKYNISDPSSTALGRLQSRMSGALEKIGPLSTQQPGWMQPRGSTITNERPFGNMPEQQTAASQMQQFDRQGLDASAAFQPGASQAQQAERYDLGNIGRQVSDASAAQQAQRYDIGNIGRQVSEPNIVRAFEAQQDRGGGGGGGGSLDRSGPSMAESGSSNRSAESGGNQGSLGGRGSFATSPDSGGAFSSSYSAREKRGGRIEKADAGGISMQYGLPTEEDIQRMAQSFAGAGAYGLSPTQQALAAKGILGAAKGGRIHKQDAGGITPTPDTQEVPDYDAAGNVVGTRREPITVSKVAPIKNNEGGIFSQRPSVITPIVEAIPKAGSAVASTASQSVEGQRTPAEVAGRSGQYAPVTYPPAKPAADTAKTATAQASAEAPKTPVITPRQAEDQSMKALAEYQPPASDFVATGQTTAAAPSVGRRRMPDTGLVQETGGKAPQVYAPYVAPPPPDITNLLGWAASGQLLGGGFGTSLANAANNYARGLQAQQEQQLGYQKGQAEVAQKYAETALKGAQTIKEGVHMEGNFPFYIGRDDNGDIFAEGLMPITPGSKQMVGVVTGNTYDQSGLISQGGVQGAAAPAAGQAAGQAAPEGQAGKGIPGLAGTAYENENFAPIMGDETQQALNDEINKRGQRAMMQYANNPSAKANTDARAAAAFADADAARKGLGPINKLALAISSVPPTGETAPGSLGQYRYNILSALNDVTSTFFGRQAFTSDDLKLADKLSANEIMNKIRATFANVQNMTTEGSRAARWLEAIADAFPNIGLQLGTSQKLLSQYYGDSLRTRNYGDFAKKYAAASGGVGQDMQNAFGSMPQNQQSRYDKIQDSIYQSMNFHMLKDKNGNPQDPKNWVTENGVYVNPITKLLDGPRKGGWTPEQFNDWAFKTFGIKNFAATFGY